MLLHRAPEPLCHRIRERAASAARVRSAGCACRDCAILLPPTPRSWPSSPSIGVCLANCSACEPSHEASRTTSRGGNGSGADQGRRVVGVVRGTEVYETSVHLGEDETLDSECTCPAGRLCKHAVAIVFAILDACAAGEDLPVAGPASPAPKPSRRSSRASRDEPGREEVHDWLRAQPKHELVAPPAVDGGLNPRDSGGLSGARDTRHVAGRRRRRIDQRGPKPRLRSTSAADSSRSAR